MSRPNIVLILSDQHNPGVLRHAGDPVVRTPNLDAMARQGIRFDSAYCGAPLCVPSRMTFLASRHASKIQVWSNSCVLRSDIPTFAHALGAAGYETVLCGRMHFEGPDQRHGFERRIVGDFTRNYPGARGGTRHTGQSRAVLSNAGPGASAVQAYDERVTEAACRFIEERSSKSRPWCLVIGYYLPHCPFLAPQELFDAYYDHVSIPPIPEQSHPAIHAWRTRRGVTDVSVDEIRRARAAYYGMVTLLDHNVGRVLAAVDRSPQSQDTVRVYLSDHGEMAGEHGMWWKSCFYEGSVRVPMIWSWPGKIPQGKACKHVVSLLDVGPTLTELAEGPRSADLDGRSLLPLLMWENGGESPAWSDEAYSEFSGMAGADPPARMVRRGPWKMTVYHGFHEPMLFNVEEDPDELNDRATDPTCADVRADLWSSIMDGWDPEEIVQRLRVRQRDDTILSAWYKNVRPPQDDLWQSTTDKGR